ncbi:MAG: hypothetical protein LAN64_16200 [Acidobacteriia bacterium]|nr:hypothetical protein [Terriglobia bacterium]
MLKVVSVLVVAWGGVYAYAGVMARSHPSAIAPVLFIVTGMLVGIGGAGFWFRKSWAATMTLLGLVGISAAALYSAVVLHGWTGMRVSHHVMRLLISAALFAGAVLAARQPAKARL